MALRARYTVRCASTCANLRGFCPAQIRAPRQMDEKVPSLLYSFALASGGSIVGGQSRGHKYCIREGQVWGPSGLAPPCAQPLERTLEGARSTFTGSLKLALLERRHLPIFQSSNLPIFLPIFEGSSKDLRIYTFNRISVFVRANARTSISAEPPAARVMYSTDRLHQS